MYGSRDEQKFLVVTPEFFECVLCEVAGMRPLPMDGEFSIQVQDFSGGGSWFFGKASLCSLPPGNLPPGVC